MVTTRKSAKRPNEHNTTEGESERNSPSSKRRKKDRSSNESTASDQVKHSVVQNNETIRKIHIVEKTGNIFQCPENTLIIHACNCEGVWGAGIAKAFKQHYPSAFSDYTTKCKEHQHTLIGKALLIPTVDKSNDLHQFVGCLFTSRRKGKSKDTPAQILEATRLAMQDLLGQIKQWQEEHETNEKIGEIRMCKINSGLFGVPWEETRRILESLTAEGLLNQEIIVIERPKS